MVAKAFRWEPGEPPPAIEAHSFAKLQVLRCYLRGYCDTLNQDVRKDRFRLDLVDGFAGGGLYLHNGREIAGSPLVMLEESQNADRRINDRRSKRLHFDVKHHFVEKDPAHAEYLRRVLRDGGHFRKRQVALYDKDFGEVIDQIISDIERRQPQSGRSIFLLDQFGYTDVDIHLVRRIGERLQNAEVILTISVDTMLNFSTKESVFTRLDSIGVPKSRIEAALRTSDDVHVKLLMQRVLPKLFSESTPFHWFTPFFIRPARSRWELWFAHFSRNVTARNVMLHCHWNSHNTFAHYGDSLDLNMLGFDGIAPSQTLPTFNERDRDTMNASITDRFVPELHDRLKTGQPLTFSRMLDHFGNRTAATIADFNNVVVAVRNAGEIQIVGADGRPLGPNLKNLKPNYGIILPRQLRLPLRKR